MTIPASYSSNPKFPVSFSFLFAASNCLHSQATQCCTFANTLALVTPLFRMEPPRTRAYFGAKNIETSSDTLLTAASMLLLWMQGSIIFRVYIHLYHTSNLLLVYYHQLYPRHPPDAQIISYKEPIELIILHILVPEILKLVRR
jgi:hypothetical protein